MDGRTDVELDTEAIEDLARAFHEIYRAHASAERAATDPSLRAWDVLDPAYQESSRALARDVPRKLARIGCALRHGAAEEFRLGDVEIELLAAAEHERWMDERKAAGWTLGPRDPAAKRSPYLVPYDALEDAIREYDRVMVRVIPEVLARAGFGVVRRRR